MIEDIISSYHDRTETAEGAGGRCSNRRKYAKPRVAWWRAIFQVRDFFWHDLFFWTSSKSSLQHHPHIFIRSYTYTVGFVRLWSLFTVRILARWINIWLPPPASLNYFATSFFLSPVTPELRAVHKWHNVVGQIAVHELVSRPRLGTDIAVSPRN